ncbi:MAG: TrmH family RNA methyltransferase [Eggerthellaceae bacterium]|jgi:tRNA G18 (ribose-2'-O)-methylase SpoU
MDIVPIASLDDERVAAYARLTERQLRNRLEPEKGIFIAESPKVIARALDAGLRAQSFLMERKRLDTAAPLVEQAQAQQGCRVPVYTGESAVLEGLTGFRLTRGVLCAMDRPALPSVSDLLAGAHRVAVLEGIVDHTNVGAAFRSAAALDVDAVLVTPTCCDPLYRRSVRVSMGTVFQVPWTRIGTEAHDWPNAGMRELRSLGFQTAAFALADDALALGDPRLQQVDRLAMVFGTEGDGLSHRTIAACDYVVKIPMAHGVDSLNVAAATAVAFWQLCPHTLQE